LIHSCCETKRLIDTHTGMHQLATPQHVHNFAPKMYTRTTDFVEFANVLQSQV
jgi:hypothetical protein